MPRNHSVQFVEYGFAQLETVHQDSSLKRGPHAGPGIALETKAAYSTLGRFPLGAYNINIKLNTNTIAT
jgi:hypothetical protein